MKFIKMMVSPLIIIILIAPLYQGKDIQTSSKQRIIFDDTSTSSFNPDLSTHRSPRKNFAIRANEEISYQIVVNPTPTVNFILTTQRVGLEFYLTDPEGRRIDKTSAAIRDLEFSEEANPLGIFSFYSVKNPKPGTWTLRVRGTYSGEGSLFAIFGDDASLQIRVEEIGAPVKRIIKVQARFTKAENPITNAKVSASFRIELDSQWQNESEIILSDEGKEQDAKLLDGIYTGIYQIHQVKQRYVVTVNASSNMIVRQADTQFRLSNKEITNIKISLEQLLRQENDSTCSDLVLEIEAQINQKGNYQFTGILTDLQDNYVATATLSSVIDGNGILEAGVQRVNLNFNGKDIWQRQRAGPYNLTLMIDCYDEQLVTYPCARYDNVFVTKVYQWQNFKEED